MIKNEKKITAVYIRTVLLNIELFYKKLQFFPFLNICTNLTIFLFSLNNNLEGWVGF